jgi:hypothetical protein
VSDANSNGPTNRWTESTPSGAFVQARLARELGDRLAPAVTFATTEHFTLQTARVATVAEANGRASIYLAALSSNLIALAFIGQMCVDQAAIVLPMAQDAEAA